MIVAILLVAVPLVPAQEVPPSDTSPVPQFSEEIEVRLVTLPVLARDRLNRPVTNLESEEIIVREGDRSYEVAFLTPFHDPTERQDLPKVRLITEFPGGGREVARPTAQEPRHLIILADVENDPPQGRKDTFDQVKEFLANELDPSFKVALMVYDGDLKLLTPFTQNREVVTESLSRVYEDPRARPRMVREVRMERFLTKLEMCRLDEFAIPVDESDEDLIAAVQTPVDVTCLRDSMHEYTGQVLPSASALLKVLEEVVGYAAGLDGHTFVLTIGGNVTLNTAREVGEAMRALFGPLDEINQLEQTLYTDEMLRRQLERLMRLAFQNDVSLSFLDRTPAPSDFSVRQDRILRPGFTPKRTAFQVAQQDMDHIAVSTGGAFVASTQIEEGLRESLSLMEGGYYVSFYLRGDGELSQERLERIDIQSSRSGVTLKHRRAFEGWRKPEEVEDRIRGIIQVGIPKEQEVEGERGKFVPLRIVLDPRDLDYDDSWEGAVANFTMHISLRNPQGQLLTDTYQVLRHSYPRQVWHSGELEPPQITAWADLPNGDYFAEVVVTVPSLGHKGKLRRHIAVRGNDPEEMTESDSKTTESKASAAPSR
ncbi:MAG: VWA domain-containing protein [Thermoanaerobaculia bacterium]|nr:VWA domain-containing protein [Thermoanaerobaculia bacterium]